MTATPMPDTTLTSAELPRPIIGIENRTPQEVFDIMCDRVRYYLARAGLEAGKAEESMRERAATVADDMRDKFGSPTGDAYSNGLWDQGVRIATAIRALPLTGGEE